MFGMLDETAKHRAKQGSRGHSPGAHIRPAHGAHTAGERWRDERQETGRDEFWGRIIKQGLEADTPNHTDLLLRETSRSLLLAEPSQHYLRPTKTFDSPAAFSGPGKTEKIEIAGLLRAELPL